MIDKYALKAIFCIALAVFFACLPIKMGNEANKNIPILGSIEKVSEDYTREALGKVAASYAIAKVVNKSISVVQKTEISVTPFGVGMSIAPGELLASAADAIDRVANVLFVILGVLSVQKVLIGMISFICLKCFFPLGLFCYAYAYTVQKFFPAVKHLSLAKAYGKFFLRFAFIIWIIFPTTAFINYFLENVYVDVEYSQVRESLETDNAKLDVSIQKFSESVPSSSGFDKKEEGGIFSWFTDKWNGLTESSKNNKEELDESFSMSELYKQLTNALNYVDNIIDNLVVMISIFLVTNILVPLSVYYLIVKLYRLLQQDIAF